ncbi:type I-E CRISPR-associated protein Cse1/CasA [Streptomyces pristinaespiralis]|uniref:type I-E CRISPR-associated protein Cse1/CasA n=1 Tax=Streptomyces pristinaespiralis TaxID=38300 RepID=UPI0033C823F8
MPETDGSSGNGVLPFGLTTQPWIPVLRGDGTQDELSLREVFAQAAGLRRIVGDLPTREFALVRLMFAVVHDALDGPQDIEDWSGLWADERCFAPVDVYLDAHRGRFDLLDAQAPLPAPAMVQRIWIARFGRLHPIQDHKSPYLQACLGKLAHPAWTTMPSVTQEPQRQRTGWVGRGTPNDRDFHAGPLRCLRRGRAHRRASDLRLLRQRQQQLWGCFS